MSSVWGPMESGAPVLPSFMDRGPHHRSRGGGGGRLACHLSCTVDTQLYRATPTSLQPVVTPNDPPDGTRSDACEDVVVQLVSGGAARAVVSSVTTPVDAVKTRLQIDNRLAATGRVGEASGIAAYAQDVLLPLCGVTHERRALRRRNLLGNV